MATSSKAGMLLTRACNFAQTTLLIEGCCFPRVLVNKDFVRNRRRTCRPALWHVPKKVSAFWHERELVPENKKFLKDLHASEFEHITSPLKEEPWERNEWKPRTTRTGVLAVKIGVQPQWTRDGKRFFTTLLQVIDNHAINYVSPEVFAESPACRPEWRRLGLGMQVIGALSTDPFKYTKAYNNLFLDAGVPPKRKLTRFLVSPNAAVQPGTPLYATHFRVGDYVDCQAKTIGHGFQGVVKRWGFKGGPASHGATKFQRRPGSMGGGGNKSAVWKGKKMPGHMGMDWTTLKGLKIWRINPEYNVIYVMGPCLPGPTHCYVRVMDTKLIHHKRALAEHPPSMPTWMPEDTPGVHIEELYEDNLHQFSEPSITFQDAKGK